MSHAIIIPDIGINHMGRYKVAKKMIKAAKDAGAEAVKLQLHIPEAEMANECYTIKPGNSPLSIMKVIKDNSLTIQEHRKLRAYAKKLNITYICTPFCREAVDELVAEDVDVIKVGSGEVSNLPLLKYISYKAKKVPIILSTGMHSISEVRTAVDILKPICVLHCVSMYPTPLNRVNLMRLEKLRFEFGISVGYSDHTQGFDACYAAICRDAAIIEKHFRILGCEGPDVPVSMWPYQLQELISFSKKWREMTMPLLPDDGPTMAFALASVVSTKDIKEGERLTKRNTTTKRPGTGIPAHTYDAVLNCISKVFIPKNSVIHWSDVY